MVKCPKCSNNNEETLYQHDSEVAGYRDYGNFYTCLICKKDFTKEEVENEVEQRNS